MRHRVDTIICRAAGLLIEVLWCVGVGERFPVTLCKSIIETKNIGRLGILGTVVVQVWCQLGIQDLQVLKELTGNDIVSTVVSNFPYASVA